MVDARQRRCGTGQDRQPRQPEQAARCTSSSIGSKWFTASAATSAWIESPASADHEHARCCAAGCCTHHTPHARAQACLRSKTQGSSQQLKQSEERQRLIGPLKSLAHRVCCPATRMLITHSQTEGVNNCKPGGGAAAAGCAAPRPSSLVDPSSWPRRAAHACALRVKGRNDDTGSIDR